MLVVAHEDDDLLFMSPDIADAISATTATTTVYVTAGEISGNGSTPGARARSRQLGIMAAYCMMAGLPASSVWDRVAVTVAGRQVERYRLRDRPEIQLYFVNLPDG